MTKGEKEVILESLHSPKTESWKSSEYTYGNLGRVQRKILGYFAVFISVISVAMADSISQLLGSTVPAMQLVFHAHLVQLVLIAPIIINMKGNIKVPLKTSFWLILFAVLVSMTLFLSTQAVKFLPAALYTSLGTTTIMVASAILSRIVLEEQIRAVKVAAMLLGSVGVILMLQPGGLFLPSPDAVPAPPDAGNMTLNSRRLVSESDAARNTTIGPIVTSLPVSVSFIFGCLLAVMVGLGNAVCFVIQPSKLREVKKQILVSWTTLVGTAFTLIMMFSTSSPVIPSREYLGLTVLHAIGGSLIWPSFIVALTLMSPVVIACLLPFQLIIMFILQNTVLHGIIARQVNLPMEVVGLVLVGTSAVLTPLFDIFMDPNPDGPVKPIM